MEWKLGGLLLNKMKAAVLTGLNESLQILEVPIPSLEKNEVLIKILAASINHRDIWIQKGQYAGIKYPTILGSDCCGVVVKVESENNQHWIGKRVIVQPGFNWGENELHQSKAYHILGLPTDGTFAEYVKAPADMVFAAPNYLTDFQAAALPLAGVTSFRAIFSKAKVAKNEKVLIAGIGGGVAFFAMQWAVFLGAEVWVTSSSDHKIQEAIRFGAKGGVNYTNENWKKEFPINFDVIIDSAGGNGFSDLLDVANFGARIVMYGGSNGNIAINPQKLFWKQIQIMGTTMGSPTDFKAMLEKAEEFNLIPLVNEIYPLEKINEAFTYIISQKQMGKVILHQNNKS